MHGDTYEQPPDAANLATSSLYEQQAFRWGDVVYGLQFHSEVTIEGCRRWQNQKWDVYDRPGVQSRTEQDRLMYQHDAAQAEWFYGFLENLFGRPA